jgi:hypothetical protein
MVHCTCVNKYDCPLSCTCTAWRWQWVLIQRRGCPHHRPPGWRSHSCSLLRWNSWKYNFVEVSGNNLPSILSFHKIFFVNKLNLSFLHWLDQNYVVTVYQLTEGVSKIVGWTGGGGASVKRLLCDKDCKGTLLSSRPNWVPQPPHPQGSVAPPPLQGGRHTRLRGRW